MQVTKRFEFSYGHCLPNHSGKCRNLHGHNAVLEVTVSGDIHPLPGTSSEGMLIDFSELKRLVNWSVVDVWDHKMLVAGDEPIVEAFVLYENVKERIGLQDQLVNVGCRTTAENLAKAAYKLIVEGIETNYGRGLVLNCVRFFETPTSWAEYTNDDWTADGFRELDIEEE